MSRPPSPWFEFRILGTSLEEGIDARVLSRFLADLTGALRFMAADRLALGQRRGPLTPEERALAGVRITAVASGSVAFQFAPPPPIAHRYAFSTRDVTADEVIEAFIDECRAIGSDRDGALIAIDGGRERNAVTQVLRAASRIGDSAVVRHVRADGEEFEASVLLERAWEDQRLPDQSEIAQRIIVGHVYMVDVELGRQRLRVKLPNDTDVTLDVDPDLIPSLSEVIDRLVALHVSELAVAGTIMERVVGSYEILSAISAADFAPPRTLTELAMERGLLLLPPPDYVELASGIWEDIEDVEQFDAYLRDARSRPLGA